MVCFLRWTPFGNFASLQNVGREFEEEAGLQGKVASISVVLRSEKEKRSVCSQSATSNDAGSHRDCEKWHGRGGSDKVTVSWW